MSSRSAPQRLAIGAPHGQLQALLQEPPEPRFAAVVCHPHPLYGGTMDNNVVYRLARGLEAAGGAALRFNFRGVGASTGSWADGLGEQEDVRTALDWLHERHPALPLWATGFSFGARVGLVVGAHDARVQKLLGIGLALSLLDYGFLTSTAKPKAFVQGERDEFGASEEVAELVGRMAEPKKLFVVPGAAHLFAGKLPEVERAIAEAVEFLDGVRPAP